MTRDAIHVGKACAFAAVVILASCGDKTSAPASKSSGTRAGDASSDACEDECAQADGEASLTNDGGLLDASVDTPDAGSAVDAGTDTGPGGPPQPVGGQLFGLTPGESITLQNNSGDNLTLSANGTFTFANPVAGAGAYGVTISSLHLRARSHRPARHGTGAEPWGRRP
jgi:hypothetical protein